MGQRPARTWPGELARALKVLAEEEPDADLAALAAQVGRFMLFSGQKDLALERLEQALDIAERLALPETLSQAFNSKGVLLTSSGRAIEGLGLVRNALEIALQHDKPSAALRAYYNLADLSVQVDQAEESSQIAREGLAFARRVGNRYWEWSFLGFAYPLFLLGDWNEVVAREAGLPNDDWTRVRIAFTTLLTPLVPVRVHRGELDEAQELTRFFADLETSADMQELAQVRLAEASLHFAAGRPDLALSCAQAALEAGASMGIAFEAVKEAVVIAVDSALALDDVDHATELLDMVDSLPVGHSPRYLRAQSARFRARLAARAGDRSAAQTSFESAIEMFRALGYPFSLGVVLLEQAEWLAAAGDGTPAGVLLAEAGDIFASLGARPWSGRVLLAQTPAPDIGLPG